MQTIGVLVKAQKGKTHQIELDHSSSIRDLKEKIANNLREVQENAPEPGSQLLIFSGKLLEDQKTLIDYDIQQDSTIFLSIRPPPNDIFRFDECCSCHAQVVEPTALPCGHSCCRSCIIPEATVCPAKSCGASLEGLTRDTMPENWVAALFTEPRTEEPKPIWCQTCLEDSIEKEATQWCEVCLRTSKIGYFCDECATSEHSTRTTKSHVRLPLGRLPTIFVFPECPTHRLHEDFYCIDDNKLVCHRCLRDDHKPHRTKLAADYAEESRADLQSEVLALGEKVQKKEEQLNKHKEDKEEQLRKLEEQMNVIRKEVAAIEEEVYQLQSNNQKTKSASAVLMKAVEEFPVQDIYDKEKLRLMKERVYSVSKALLKEDAPKPKRARPQLKETFSFLKKFTGPTDFELNIPRACCVTPDGKIFVADTQNHHVAVFDREGGYLRSFGSRGSGEGQFDGPCAICCDLDGNILVADNQNNRIEIFTPGGEFKLAFGTSGTGDGQLKSPNGVTVDNDGNIIVADSDNNRLQVFSSQGVWIKTFGSRGSGEGEFSLPIGVVVNAEDQILVCDKDNHRVQIFDQNGKFLKALAPPQRDRQFSHPWGIAVDKNGTIVVADQSNHRVQVYTADLQFVAKFGGDGDEDGEMSWPLHLAIDWSGNVVVADSRNSRVQVFG